MIKFEKISKGQYIYDFMNTFNCLEKEAQAAFSNIQLPKRATEGSAGYDFYAPFDFSIYPNETIVIPTGIRFRVEDRQAALLLYPRSGLGFKSMYRLANTVGVIDRDYYEAENQGHIFVKLFNPSEKDIKVAAGGAFAQGIITPYIVTDDDESYKARVGGLGSTSSIFL